MYNLKIGGKRVTNLRLSGEVLAKIFTGKITQWNDPAIKADNPGLTLPGPPHRPGRPLRRLRHHRPVHRCGCPSSTAPSGTTTAAGRASRTPCGLTSYYPVVPGSGFVAQSGSLGVAGYAKQSQAEGTITYVEYSYAMNAGLPGRQGAQQGRLLRRADRLQRRRRPDQGADQQRPALGELPDPEPRRRLPLRRPAHLPAVELQLHDHPDQGGDAASPRPRARRSATSPTTSSARASSRPTGSATRRCRSTWWRPAWSRCARSPAPTAAEHRHQQLQQPDVLRRRQEHAGQERAVPAGVRQEGLRPVRDRHRRQQDPHDGQRRAVQRRQSGSGGSGSSGGTGSTGGTGTTGGSGSTGTAGATGGTAGSTAGSTGGSGGTTGGTVVDPDTGEVLSADQAAGDTSVVANPVIARLGRRPRSAYGADGAVGRAARRRRRRTTGRRAAMMANRTRRKGGVA